MKDISWWKLFWLYILAVFTIEIILATFFSVRSGIVETFPYLYILPIILIARTHPRFAIYFTIVLGWIYLALVYFLMPFEIRSFASGIAWFYIFVTIGVVVSSLAESGKQDRKFREMFDNALAGIFTVDLDSGKIVRLNARTAHLLGYAPGELEGRDFSELWYHEREVGEFFKKIPLTTVADPLEAAFRKMDGRLVWVLLAATNAGSSRMVCSVVDITDKKRIGDELIESELRYHMLFDRATDAILIHETDGSILNANETASRLSGYSQEKLKGLRLQDLGLLPEEGMPPDQKTDLLAKGHNLFESLLMAKDGTPLPVEVSCKIIEYNGQPALISSIRDITERHRAQAALIESETRYRMIGDLIPFGVWSADEKGNYTYLSQSFLSVLGITLEECRRTGWMHLLPPQDYDRTIADWRQCIQNGAFWDYEYRIMDKSGKISIVLSRGAPHMAPSGKITSWVGIHLDITERKRYEERLESSLQEKEYVIKEVHHRVKNNMQVISGFLELQSNYLSDPLAVEKLGECQQRVRTMALVHEKLYQARNLGVINASDYIRSLIADLMNSYPLKTAVDVSVVVDDINITIDLAIPCGLIINELVTNSVKYAFAERPEGTIAISLNHRHDHTFCLVVRDDGIGLPQDFETRSASSLGMQLVKVLVHQIGGTITIGQDQGTVFTIIFPEKF